MKILVHPPVEIVPANAAHLMAAMVAVHPPSMIIVDSVIHVFLVNISVPRMGTTHAAVRPTAGVNVPLNFIEIFNVSEIILGVYCLDYGN